MTRPARLPVHYAHHRQLMCEPVSLHHDFRLHITTVVVAEANCTDMTGAIRMARALDPKATQIDVFQLRTDGTPRLDLSYVRMPEDEWIARWYRS